MSIGNGGPAGAPGPGHFVINKFGENPDVDIASVPEAIWSHGGSFPWISAGIAMDIVSDDAADTLAGTGAQKIRLTIFRTDFTRLIVEKDMDGVTPVQVDDDVLLCSRMEVIQSGSGMINAGEINLVDRATGLIVYQSVEIGEGQTLSTVEMCPKDQKGLVKSHKATFTKTVGAGEAQLRVRLRKPSGTILTKWNPTLTQNKTEDEKIYIKGGIEMEAGDAIFWEALDVSLNDTAIEGSFDIEFENAS
jgi:hypothetical protein